MIKDVQEIYRFAKLCVSYCNNHSLVNCCHGQDALIAKSFGRTRAVAMEAAVAGAGDQLLQLYLIWGV